MKNIYDDSGNNNEPDYDNNLAFNPSSADDLNKQERQLEVLVTALEKCEMLEKKLEIAVKALGHYSRKGSLAQEALAKIKELDK